MRAGTRLAGVEQLPLQVMSTHAGRCSIATWTVIHPFGCSGQLLQHRAWGCFAGWHSSVNSCQAARLLGCTRQGACC